MEWIKKILGDAKIEDGKIDIDAIITSINSEFPKHAIPKEKFNDVNGQLKEANATIKSLQESNANNEQLTAKIQEYQNKMDSMEKEFAIKEKTNQIKSAFEKVGATDVDYMVFKLGDINAFDIKNLDNKIKELQESTPQHFKIDDSTSKPSIVANKLNGANAPTPDESQKIADAFKSALNGGM